MSSEIPSEKYSCSGSPLMLVNASTAMDGLSGNGKASPVPCTRDRSIDLHVCGGAEPQQKCLDGAGDVLQIERPEFVESKIEAVLHMIAHRSCDTDVTRRTFSLNSCGHIHRIAV